MRFCILIFLREFPLDVCRVVLFHWISMTFLLICAVAHSGQIVFFLLNNLFTMCTSKKIQTLTFSCVFWPNDFWMVGIGVE